MNMLLALVLAQIQLPDVEALYDGLEGVDRTTPVTRVVEAVAPAVVFIETELTEKRATFFGVQSHRRQGGGSGVVVRPEGYIVTNYHVVRGATSIHVSFQWNPERHPAQLVSYSREEDLALLKIAPMLAPLEPGREPSRENGRRLALAAPGEVPMVEVPFPTVRLGTSADLMPGEQVVAIGNPHGQTHTVSTGIISGLHRDVQIPQHGLRFDDLIQTDASINLGNSGGPLLNVRGELIGINTAMNLQAENIGFALPVDRIDEILNDILFPQARKSWLGFELRPDERLVVDRVWPGGPAESAGLCEGDRLVGLGTRALRNREDFLLASLELPPHEEVEIEYLRAGERRSASVRSWDKLDGILYQRLGMTVRDVGLDNLRLVMVTRLRADGPAERIGLQPGDMIPVVKPRSWRGRGPLAVPDKKMLAQVVEQLAAGDELEIEVYRDENADRVLTREERYVGALTVAPPDGVERTPDEVH